MSTNSPWKNHDGERAGMPQDVFAPPPFYARASKSGCNARESGKSLTGIGKILNGQTLVSAPEPMNPPTTNQATYPRAYERDDFKLLKKLDSPLYRQLRRLVEGRQTNQQPETLFTVSERAEMVYQIAIPISQARQELKRGRDYFRAQAMQAVAALTEDELQRAVTVVSANFTTAIETALTPKTQQRS